MKPMHLLFKDSPDPEACRKAYILGYRAGYKDGQCGNADATRQEDGQKEPIEAMPLSVHAYNCLSRSGCRYVEDVVKLTADQISRIRGMGKKTAQEIVNGLAERGITDTDWDFAWLIE